MNSAPELLLIGAVASVGVLHTIVPDHWVPITLIARQRGWSKAETARAAFQAGAGHVLSTLLIGLVVWLAGVVAAARFGHLVETASSIALIAFGGWIAISAWRELRTSGGHGHSHSHGFGQSEEHRHHDHQNQVHGPELQQIATGDGVLELSIFEAGGSPPRFRLSGVSADAVTVETLREAGARQVFRFARQGLYWESVEEIPEPHGFEVTITLEHDGHAHTYETQFSEHDHGHAHRTSTNSRRQTTRFMHRCEARPRCLRDTATSTGMGAARRMGIGMITCPLRLTRLRRSSCSSRRCTNTITKHRRARL